MNQRSKYKYFTKRDLSMFFYCFELDDKSKDMCTINTPFGLYHYTQLFRWGSNAGILERQFLFLNTFSLSGMRNKLRKIKVIEFSFTEKLPFLFFRKVYKNKNKQNERVSQKYPYHMIRKSAQSEKVLRNKN